MCPTCNDLILTRQMVLDDDFVLLWQGCQCGVMNVWMRKRVDARR